MSERNCHVVAGVLVDVVVRCELVDSPLKRGHHRGIEIRLRHTSIPFMAVAVKSNAEAVSRADLISARFSMRALSLAVSSILIGPTVNESPVIARISVSTALRSAWV